MPIEDQLVRVIDLLSAIAGSNEGPVRVTGNVSQTASMAQAEIGRRQLYENLFADPGLVVDLGAALRNSDIAVRVAAANKVLAKANRGTDPQFTEQQVESLGRLWINEEYELLRPSSERQIAIEALWFWRELVSLRPDEVIAFHQAVTTWGNLGTAEAWQEVVLFFDRVGLAHRWKLAHGKALLALKRDSVKFKSLRWFGTDSDGW